MTHETPPPPRSRRPRKPPAVPAPSPSGGQSFQLLTFPKQGPIVKPVPQVVEILEDWLKRAREGRVLALGLAAVTDEGQMQIRSAHNRPTVSGLLTGCVMLQSTLVHALETVYAAPPGTGQSVVKPENEVPE